jgi:hypothetical protein
MVTSDDLREPLENLQVDVLVRSTLLLLSAPACAARALRYSRPPGLAYVSAEQVEN